MQASSNFSTRTWSDLGYINNIPNRIVDRSHFNTKMQNNIHCINFVKHTSNISNILERNFMTFKHFSRAISRYSTGGGVRLTTMQLLLHLVPLSLLCSARYYSPSTELLENVTSAALEETNHAIGENWKYLCERSEKPKT